MGMSRRFSSVPILKKVLPRVELLPSSGGVVASNGIVGRKPNRSPRYNYLLANITIGNPAQELQLKIDVNTDEFWVISKECKAVQCRGLKGHMYPFRNKQQYDATTSSSARPTTQKFGLGFGQGFVSGMGIRDQVTVGDITLSNREVAAASNIQLFFGYEPADGVLGLGFEAIKPGAKSNWELPIDSLLANKDKIYSLQLSEAGHRQLVGEINFGQVDKEVCSGKIEFIESIDENSWKLRLDGIRVSDVEVAFNGRVALDPASVFIQAPNDLVNAIYNVIKPIHMSYWGYVMECDKIPETPSIFINVNGIELEIESKNYILDVSDM
ncbi:unnamed protein product [Bursaphelenchus xylophilus]|uniref:(pine wood nematode) hypothetical protein n=1 Tax=Bursaphelenchus xylophilus TaxID=6326 RepID=A0A1I7RN57_BURXY|nr:unnamed protein product [Bursaphelenchus xylophilus]CAG9087725.1 unnamed protein product [Bursaphelenchus xylophilus]